LLEFVSPAGERRGREGGERKVRQEQKKGG